MLRKRLIVLTLVCILFLNLLTVSIASTPLANQVPGNENSIQVTPGQIMTAIRIFKTAAQIRDHLVVDYHHSDSGYNTDSLDGNYSYKIITMGFNNYGGSSYGPYAYNRYKATHTGQEITGFATSNNVFYDALALEIRNLRTHQIVRTGTIKDGSIITYKVPASGRNDEYEVKYNNPTTKKSWNLGWRFRHYYAEHTGQLPYSLISPNLQLNHIESFGENVQVEVIDNRLLRKPLVEKKSIQSNQKSNLTYFEFSEQFYDKNNDIYLNYAADYSAGDYLVLKDKMVEVNYLPSKDITTLGFNNGENLDYITFQGDLTNEHKVGDYIKLQFKLLPINDTEYVELDYNVDYYEAEEPPNIDDYIVDF